MPKPDVTEERKNQIIAAATAVFAEKGFYEARMDDIVEASGLSKGTLYWYFDSKDAIIFAILDDFFNQELAGMEQLASAEISAGEKIKLLIQQMTLDVHALTIYQSIALEFYALANRREEVRLTLLDYFKTFQIGIGQLIQQGINEGEFRLVDPTLMAGVLISQLEGVVLLWAFDPQNFDLQTYTTTSIDLFITALSAHPP
ncbi:MAG: TetR/AcrR family transcriptional regulator [Candidatus Promineifilaceae bacterium]